MTFGFPVAPTTGPPLESGVAPRRSVPWTPSTDADATRLSSDNAGRLDGSNGNGVAFSQEAPSASKPMTNETRFLTETLPTTSDKNKRLADLTPGKGSVPG